MNNERKIMVVKEFTFDAAHCLPGYKGDCANLHGHTYRLQIGIIGSVNPESGMVMDFKQLKNITKPILDQMDHAYLNNIKVDDFPTGMPTAENMVIWITDQIRMKLYETHRRSLELGLVRLWETPTSFAEWTKNG
jgi:6-pyruvoyltetrahydropterin/6-carboxytetrahydropterin synthase